MRTTYGLSKGLWLAAIGAVVACGGTPQDPADPGQTVESSPPPDQGSMVDPGPPAPTDPVKEPDIAPDMGAAIHAHFEVEDFAKWKSTFDSNADARVAAGQTWSIIGHLMEDENRVVVRVGFKDAASAKSFASSSELQEAMKQAGVKGKPTVWIADNWAMSRPTQDLVGMATYMMIAAFDVSDFSAWKKKFDAMADKRRQAGEFAHFVGRALDNRSRVVLTVALSGDMPSAESIMGTHEVKDAMHQCGAKSEPDVWFAKTEQIYWRGSNPVLLVQHKVSNFDKWKKAFDAHMESRKKSGVVWHHVARDKKNVLVVLDGKDRDQLMAFSQSEDLKKAMTDAGVKGKPTMWWATEVEGVNHGVEATGSISSFVIRHEVADFDAWKKAYDAHRGARIAAGVIGDRVHRAVDNPNVVIVTGFAADAKKLKKFMRGKSLKKAMKAAGVKGKPTIWTGTKVEIMTYPN